MAKSYPDKIPSTFDRADLASAYRRGWNHGHGIACHNVPRLGDRISPCIDWCGLGRIVTAENIRDYHMMLCHEAESHSRQYSPFEFTAHEFNSAECDDGNWDPDKEGLSAELWEAFDAGVHDAIAADLAEYTDDNYGIEGDE